MSRFLFLGLIALVVWLVLGGPKSQSAGTIAASVTLAQLAKAPSDWNGRLVTVTGTVVDRANVMGVGGVLISDESGHQLLAAGWTDPVLPGKTAQVTGEYRLALAVGDLEIPMILVAPKGGG